MAIKTRSTTMTGSRVCAGSDQTINPINSKDDLIISTSANPGGANPFQSDHKLIAGSIFRTRGGSFLKFQDWPSSLYDLNLGITNFPGPSTNDFERTLALTNPANPIINVPNFIWELRDIPDMIRQGVNAARAIKAGATAAEVRRNASGPHGAAAANLAIEFGWLPFLGDLIKIGKLQESVERRRKMFDKLAKTGLRGKVGLGSTGESFIVSWPLHSDCGFLATIPLNVSLTAKRWGTVRWEINQTMPIPKTDGEILRHATGFRADNIPLAVWESLPWSWLADWFIGVDTMLKASNHTIAYPSHVCVMTQYTSTAGHAPFSWTIGDAEHTVSGGLLKVWRNTRYPLGGVLPVSASVPFLTGHQLSILGSLWVLRSKAGRRL